MFLISVVRSGVEMPEIKWRNQKSWCKVKMYDNLSS